MKLVTLVSGMLCFAPLAAQEEPRTKDQKDPQAAQKESRIQDHVALSDVLGAKVQLKPKPEEGREAAAEGRTAKGPNGSISNLLVDAGSGQITWAIVSVGGLLGIGDKEVAVPTTALKSNRHEDKPLFELEATEAELKTLPAFDKKAIEKTGLQTAAQSAEAYWRKIRPDAKFRPVDATGARSGIGNGNGKGHAGAPVGTILGSQVKGMNVRTRDAEAGKNFGEVEAASVDCANCGLSFLVIGRGGVLGIGETDYLVPFGATRVIMVDEKPVLALDKTTSEMESATKYVKPDKGVVSDENARASCKFFGIEGKHEAKPGDGK